MGILGLPEGYTSVGPPHFSIETIIRPNVLSLHPYRCARDDYQSGVLLDANENSLGHSIPTGSGIPEPLELYALNRYPDPSQIPIKTAFASLRELPSHAHVFLGVGSDEVIDLLIRVFCTPARDKILITPPTYGMYAVCAQMNDVALVKVNLNVQGGAFQLQMDEVKKQLAADPNIKLVFLCSPGNPTGTLIPLNSIRAILEYPEFKGVVVVDEAYIDFSPQGQSAASLVAEYGNLCVMQTLSKSFGLAAIRLGVALAQPPLIQILSNAKAPYNISSLTSKFALSALTPEGIQTMRRNAEELAKSRANLIVRLERLRFLGVGSVIGGNHANFVLLPILKQSGVSMTDYDNKRSTGVYRKMAEELGVVVRYRGSEYGCGGCLRITVGSETENALVLDLLEEALKLV